MALTGVANSLENAVHKSQRAANLVQFEGKYFRHDIGMDLIRYNDQMNKKIIWDVDHVLLVDAALMVPKSLDVEVMEPVEQVVVIK